MALALIALGSNLGDRAANIRQALAALGQRAEIKTLRTSSLIETAPVGGPPGQGPFLNAAAVLETRLAPEKLLSVLLGIESELGRVRGEHWGPRTIDLDLLLYEQVVHNSGSLTIPHPRMAERPFVLEPAAEIAPEMLHPVLGLTVRQMRDRLAATSKGASPDVIKGAVEMQERVQALKATGKRIGLVPTMGALHEGHLSLVRAARQRADVVIATIFVNPAQFGPQEDFARYPRTFDADLALLASEGCDLVFAPSNEEIYPAGFSTYIEPPAIALPLEGVCRPGHFRGVATIVLKLFQIIPAQFACFGHKDFQQVQVIRHMVRDLNVAIEIVVCPTVREADGLAMSSRNRYLSPAEREQALAIPQSLQRAEQLVAGGRHDAAQIAAEMRVVLKAAGIQRIDYVAVADPETLQERKRIEAATIALVAAYVGTTRLIDNRTLAAR